MIVKLDPLLYSSDQQIPAAAQYDSHARSSIIQQWPANPCDGQRWWSTCLYLHGARAARSRCNQSLAYHNQKIITNHSNDIQPVINSINLQHDSVPYFLCRLHYPAVIYHILNKHLQLCSINQMTHVHFFFYQPYQR